MRLISYSSLLLLMIGCKKEEDPQVKPTQDSPVFLDDDQDDDGFGADEDCDDANPDVYPGQEELCNGIDDNCDGVKDFPGFESSEVWYLDKDLDGVGGLVVFGCEPPENAVQTGGDCNDHDPLTLPGAAERCDGADNDCDGEADEDAVDASLWYADADQDGYGDAGFAQPACSQPEGYVDNATDCNDEDEAFNPSAAESCTDTTDYNCDGSVGYADNDGDGVAACEECNDGDAMVYPGATEVCDGIDNNCDGTTDSDAVDQQAFYLDLDGDGYGDEQSLAYACAAPGGFVSGAGDCDDGNVAFNPGASESCADPNDYNCDGQVGYRDADQDGFAACEECDDGNAAVYPGATETCDGIDNNCDGQVDSDAIDPSTWYADADGDGFGDGSQPIEACTLPVGYVSNTDDCNDGNAQVSPAEVELCDGFDNNCDGVTDTDAVDRTVWYADMDADGFGDATHSQTACTLPPGYSADATDCQDGNASIYPGAPEACTDRFDLNCDGQVSFVDADSDGFAACEDCDDTNLNARPGAPELCDGIDNDCDGTADIGAIDARPWYRDQDGDTYGNPGITQQSCTQPPGYSSNDADCDDTHAESYPAATEFCDGLDNDCDGSTDTSAVDASTWYRDQDGDTYGTPGTTQQSCTQPPGYVADATDCDDTRATRFPGNDELCDNLDNDCDGSVDNGAIDATAWFMDDDGDGFGDASASVLDCSAPTGFVANATDCDDSDASAYPGGVELCDSADNDCDGTVNNNAIDAVTWYADQDSDGYGDAGASVSTCSQPSGYQSNAADCNDQDPATSPAATEACDGVDNDCDGTTDEAGATGETTWYRDLDSDGYGAAGSTASGCSAPTGYVADATDCEDSAATAYPGATTVCQDGLDNNCDGIDDCRLEGTVASNTADVRWVGAVASDCLGCTVASGGDLDGDGKDDLLVSAEGYDSTLSNVGRTYIFSGTSSFVSSLSSAVATVTSNLQGDALGHSVAIIGDANNDGYDDAVFGIYKSENGTLTDAGSAMLLYGPISGAKNPNNKNILVKGGNNSDGAGYQVAAAGDVDGDGLADWLVSAWQYDAPAGVNDAGRVALYSGATAQGTYTIGQSGSSQTALFSGTSSGAKLGTSVAGVGDVDGDGFDDVLLGAPYQSSSTGSAYLFYGPLAGSYSPSGADAVFTGAAAGDELGNALAGVGDVDEDGYADMLVGAHKSDEGGTDAGSAWIFVGGTSVGSGSPSAAYAGIIGGAAADYVGRSVAGAGDVDGDGTDDLMVAGTAIDTTTQGVGATAVFYGPMPAGTWAYSSADFQIYGSAAYEAAGASLANGDVDGDGFSDLVVGSSGTKSGSNTVGSAQVFFGTGE